MTSQVTRISICKDCKKQMRVNLANQCFECWNFKRSIKEARKLNKKWRISK